MIIKELSPNQIITLNDFPVHNEHILKIYFKVFRDGYKKMIPPCPVLHKGFVAPIFEKIFLEFKEFQRKNPHAEYFLLDGSHKTTAANLTGNKVKVMILENNKDIKEAKQLVNSGELFSLRVSDSISDNVKDLKKHFKKKQGFQTVEEKTKRMIKEKVIPAYMIKYYKHKK